MLNDRLGPAIEALVEELDAKLQEVAALKSMINSLRSRMGEDPLYQDVEIEDARGSAIRPDQFYSKPLSTAVQDLLRPRRTAMGADEIVKGLEQGGFDFKAMKWKAGNRSRNLAITLSKNSKTFHRLPNGMFGLLEWYPEAVKRQEAKGNGKEPEAGGSSEGDSGESAERAEA